MKKYPILFLIALIIGLTACGGDEEPTSDFSGANSGSSASSGGGAANTQPAANMPRPVQLAMLELNPTAYDGDLVEIVGRLSFRPRTPCDGEAQESPAAWQLAADNATIPVGGFDEQVRLLLHEEQTMRVVGRWMRWQGPVGCGSDAQQEQFRYLAVTRILWPNPLTHATLTPMAIDGSAAVAAEVSPTDDAIPESTGTPTSTMTTAPTANAATPTATPSPNNGAPQPTAINSATPSILSSPTASPAPGTPSATPSATPTAAATPSSHTATPTQPATFTLINQGQIDPEALAAAALKPLEIHSFSFTMDDLNEVSIAVAGEPGLDLVITVLDEFGSQVSATDNQPAGKIERIENLSLAQGNYTIQVQGQTGQSGSYMIMLLFADSYTYSFMDMIVYGQTASGTTNEENDHFWLFYGETGDVITIMAAPNDSGDLFLELYGPSAEIVSDFVDDGWEGEPEILSGFTLTNSGLFAIRVGEYNFNPMSYQLVVTAE